MGGRTDGWITQSWSGAHLFLPLSTSFLQVLTDADAAVPRGIISCKERASNPSAVTVVLVYRYRFCTVYTWVPCETVTMRSSLVPETFFCSACGAWYLKKNQGDMRNIYRERGGPGQEPRRRHVAIAALSSFLGIPAEAICSSIQGWYCNEWA